MISIDGMSISNEQHPQFAGFGFHERLGPFRTLGISTSHSTSWCGATCSGANNTGSRSSGSDTTLPWRMASVELPRINVVGCVLNQVIQFVTFWFFTFTGHVKNVYTGSPSQKGHRNCQVYKIHVIYRVIFCQLRPGQVPYQAPPQASILEASGDAGHLRTI